MDTFDSLSTIGYPLDPFIIDLTGITDEMLGSAPSLDEAVSGLSKFAADSVPIAHVASFAMNFLRIAFERVLSVPLKNDYVDALRVARRAFPHMGHYRLANICAALDVENDSKRRALPDALATVDCYEWMRLLVLERYFTGKMTSMVRRDAVQALKNVGRNPQDDVKKDTDYLIIGNDGFAKAIKEDLDKIKKAKKNQLNGSPIQMISEDAFLLLLDSGEIDG